MKETAQGGIRRPGRVPFVLMCILLVILIVLNAALITLVPQYFDTINSFLAPAADEEATAAAAQASKDMTQEIESEGIVLLENNDSTLPLSSGTAVNLFGYGSRDTVYGGSGSGSGDSTNNVTLAQGLENAGLTVNQELVDFYDEHYIERTGVGYTGNNFDINEPSVDEYSDELLENAKAYSSVAVFVISRLGGEGADLPMDMDPDKVTEIVASGALTEQTVSGGDAGKHYLELQQVEIDVLNMIKENFDTVIVLVNSTNAMELGWLEEDGIDAALWIGCLGSTGANAVGEVLAGIVNPSGRTSDTFAYEVESAPSYYSLGDYDYTNIEWTNTNPIAAGTDPDNYHYVDYIEGIYVGYRYYETAAADGFIDYDATVQYPFGYGLSYTSFEQEITNFTDDGTTITVDVTVTNTGSVAGKDVVQVYYTAPYTVGGIEKSEVVLADFGKTETLEPGTSETVTISFLYEDMASYDYSGIKAAGGAYVLEAGEYEIKLMNNSHDLIDSRTVTVDADVIYNDENDGARSTDSIAAVNQFDDVSFGECTTYLTRADWEGTFPTERAAFSREASEETLAVINDTSIPTDDSAEAIVVADHGLTLEDVAGLDYDDPLWDDLLEQVSVDEMVNLVSNGG
ncbi:MAG: glycoside hydrolase family 3 C-terminal domain-containing protein, partial [Clostridiales bacterium]|nr:glycoside hydrolase family 3 C-terminal domain-containing protein [Clostridiales bacterium]